jgi:preprotein translocase subunit YajC
VGVGVLSKDRLKVRGDLLTDVLVASRRGQNVLVYAAAEAANGGGGATSLLLPLLIIMVVLFFIMTSGRRRRREQESVQAALAPGAMVVTTAGLYATVEQVDGTDVLLEVAPDVVCRFTRAAIVRVVTPNPGEEQEPGAGGADGEPSGDTGESPVSEDDGATPAGRTDDDARKPPKKEL